MDTDKHGYKKSHSSFSASALGNVAGLSHPCSSVFIRGFTPSLVRGPESQDNTLPFQARVLEVQNQPYPQLCDSEVVEHLTTLVICNPLNYFCIDYDRPEYDQIRDKLTDLHCSEH